MFELKDDFMPEVIEVTRVSLLQIDVEVRKGICKLDISEPFMLEVD